MTELKTYHPIQLMASPHAWRLYSARKMDPKFSKFEHKIFIRDHYTCQYCGFKAKIYQDVVNLDANYNNNNPENMVTACCFCAQCFFIESVGVGGFGGGTLIFLPDISQADINSLCQVLFCAMTNDTGYKISAQAIYRSFKFRAQLIEDKFGEGTSDPAIFGHLLIDSGQFSTDNTQKILNGIRLLPSRAKFRPQIEAWAASALEEVAK